MGGRLCGIMCIYTLIVLRRKDGAIMELNEGLKKILLAGVGAVAVTAETAKDVVDNLVKKGELTVEQGKVLNEELKQNAKEKMKEHVSVTIVKEYKDAMDAVDHMDADDLEALKARIAEAEKANAQKAAAGTGQENETDAADTDSCEGKEACDGSEAAPSEETCPESPAESDGGMESASPQDEEKADTQEG